LNILLGLLTPIAHRAFAGYESDNIQQPFIINNVGEKIIGFFLAFMRHSCVLLSKSGDVQFSHDVKIFNCDVYEGWSDLVDT